VEAANPDHVATSTNKLTENIQSTDTDRQRRLTSWHYYNSCSSLPGPAVTAATPTLPDNLATASAANTAVTYTTDMSRYIWCDK